MEAATGEGMKGDATGEESRLRKDSESAEADEGEAEKSDGERRVLTGEGMTGVGMSVSHLWRACTL
jgi:hypothetical protein